MRKTLHVNLWPLHEYRNMLSLSLSYIYTHITCIYKIKGREAIYNIHNITYIYKIKGKQYTYAHHTHTNKGDKAILHVEVVKQ